MQQPNPFNINNGSQSQANSQFIGQPPMHPPQLQHPANAGMFPNAAMSPAMQPNYVQGMTPTAHDVPPGFPPLHPQVQPNAAPMYNVPPSANQTMPPPP